MTSMSTHEGALQDFCGPPNNDSLFWPDKAYGYCKELLVFDSTSYALLAITSGLYIGHIQHTEHENLKRSRAVHIRLVVSLVASLSPVLGIILSLNHAVKPLAPVEYLTDGCVFFAWVVHALYLIKLRRTGTKHVRGHLPVLLMWPLTFLSTVVKVARVFRNIVHKERVELDEIARILAFVEFALQLLYLVSVLPSPKLARKNYEKNRGRPIFPSINDGAWDEASPLVGGRRRSYTLDEYGLLPDLGIAEEQGGFLSKAILWWIQPLMRRGAQGQLRSPDDVFRLPRSLQTHNVEQAFGRIFFRGKLSQGVTDYSGTYNASRLEDSQMPAGSLFSEEPLHSFLGASYSSQYDEVPSYEVRNPRSKTCAQPTLLQALLKAFGVRFFSLGIVKFVCDMLTFAGPLLLNALVTFMENKKEPVRNGWLYALGLFLSSLIGSFMSIHYNYQIFKILIRMRAALVTTTYRKALVVSSTTASQFTTGEIVNFMSVDSERIINVCRSFHELWSLPVKVTVALFLLYQQLGLAFLTGVGFTLLLIAMTKWLTVKIQKYFEDLMRHKDSRIKVMSEILYGIRVIKFYAWEKHFTHRIKELRDQELSSLKGVKYLDAMCVYFWATTPILISILSFTTYSLLGKPLTAAKIFTSLALFNMLIGPLNSFPWVLNGVIQAWVSVKRVKGFLELQELDPPTYYTPEDTMDPNSYLEIKHGSFQWDHPRKTENTSGDEEAKKSGRPAGKDVDGMGQGEEGTGVLKLSSLNLRVGRGQLVGVIGCVGSGKSSLLSAITAEMTHTGGSISVSDLMSGFGLVPQEAWAQHATLRDNVLFGTDYIAKRYRAVIEACALLEDVRILPAGDLTEIGENGVTLSGGQKARVALARAVYQDKDLYLLDDPMAAVDAHVGAHIFSQCIMGLLRNKTRILCTHHTKYLQEADVVVVMEGGEITNVGHPSMILKNKNLLTSLQYKDQEITDSTEGDSKNLEKDGAEPKTEEEDGKLVEEEEQDVGVVKLKVYKAYWNAVGCLLATSVLIAMFLMQASRNMTDWWLSYWVGHSHTNDTISSSYSSDTTGHDRSITRELSILAEVPYTRINRTSDDNLVFFLGIYGGIVGANSIFTLFRAFLFAYGGLCAARTVHSKLLASILKAPVSFFDTTPIGRIINRFSSDVYTIDNDLPFVFNIFLASLFSTVGAFALVCYGLPWFSIVLLPMFILYVYIQNYYRKTSRELRRIESVTMSPIYAHFSETLAGLPTIRALRATERFRLENATKLETNQRVRFCSFAVTCWLSVCLQMLGVGIVTAVAVISVLEHQFQTVSPGLVGLAISYTLSISSLLQSMVTTFTDTEKNMVSMERAEQYIKGLPYEQQEGLRKVAPSWPQYGQVSFKNVSFAYRPNLPNALDGVTFDLQPAEKLGIVGRTGAGKSSLLQVLFRMVEIQSGQVSIDGVDLAHLSLEELRSKLAIIPQDPFLFIGSIRENLDPTERFSDRDLWVVLEKCHLQSVVESLGGLQAQAGEKGRKFSVGQRQLVCLARAMLTGAKVLCIDEATASVDMATDRLLQRTIRQEFAASTVLTIAHRLDTIMDSDRVLVMSSGQVAELASPAELLEDPTSIFYGLVNSGNSSNEGFV
ncbi:multidrug resistance-associated protein 7-like [Acanthaster planci]|uniref:ABC-type xenobiotic transporter n=1 Tax=Acanthaster planci TaxID=133434 RepID=A0A8B7XMY8_ACAPL|nr:multidrug resistance-associated protein 7-like [Acanthaster planci]XP_022081532.1 multidrug resistance-associated protein 7-like [Acanthaster planci]